MTSPPAPATAALRALLRNLSETIRDDADPGAVDIGNLRQIEYQLL